jgi:6-phosphogluconolactonase (cycloisomerase 2 family)
MPPTSSQFPTSFIYASNRNEGTPDPRGDSIAIFQFLSGTGQQQPAFQPITQVFTGLQQIRGMEFSDDGQFLVAGAALTGGVKVFQRVDGGRGLQEVASSAAIDTRTSFVWVQAPAASTAKRMQRFSKRHLIPSLH